MGHLVTHFLSRLSLRFIEVGLADVAVRCVYGVLGAMLVSGLGSKGLGFDCASLVRNLGCARSHDWSPSLN